MSAAFASPSPKPVTATAVITTSMIRPKSPRIAPALFVRFASLMVTNSIEAVWQNIDAGVITVGRKSGSSGHRRAAVKAASRKRKLRFPLSSVGAVWLAVGVERATG